MITLQHTVKRCDELLSAPIDQELVIMGVAQGKYYGLNALARVIWQKIAMPLTVENLCRQLGEEYDVDPERCQQEVIALLNQMTEEGLIEVA